jgi:hypothetical protein
MTKLKDWIGYEYQPIEELDLGVRLDFTLNELKRAFEVDYDIGEEDEDGYQITYGKLVDYLYPPRDDIDEEGYSLTETHEDGRKKYLGYEFKDRDPIGFRFKSTGEFGYTGGVLLNFGTFKLITSGDLGDGHDAWALFEHVESGRLFLNTGWYSSWDSGEMNDWDEVEPVEQTVLRYKPLGSDKVFDNPVVDVK